MLSTDSAQGKLKSFLELQKHIIKTDLARHRRQNARNKYIGFVIQLFVTYGDMDSMSARLDRFREMVAALPFVVSENPTLSKFEWLGISNSEMEMADF